MVNGISNAIEWYKHYKAILADECGDDMELLNDTLEGVTDLDQLLLNIERERMMIDAYADALQVIIKNNKERLDKYKNRSEKLKNIILKAMIESGLQKAVAPDVTLSLRNGAPFVSIDNEAEIPAEYLVIKATPNKTALKEALQKGVNIKGVSMAVGEKTLTVKRK